MKISIEISPNFYKALLEMAEENDYEFDQLIHDLLFHGFIADPFNRSVQLNKIMGCDSKKRHSRTKI